MEKIIIEGEIGWQVFPEDIRSKLDAAAGKDVEVQISSPGGSVFDGIAIYNAIRDYKRTYPGVQMMATIKGIAASMASYIAVNPAFDLVSAEDNAVFMIHNTQGGVAGDYRDMEKMAEVLKGLNNILADAYVARCKEKKKKVLDMMSEETWLFGSEIISAGFADEIIKTDADADKSVVTADAKVKFFALQQKIKAVEMDVEKIAALVKIESFGIAGENTVPAVVAGKIKEDDMNLSEFLNQNPSAKTELDEMIKSAGEAKYAEGRKSMSDTVAAAGKYLSADSAYPAPIKSLAVEVLNGKKSIEALETVVAAFDAMKAAGESAAAKIDTGNAGTAAGQQTPAPSADGVMNSMADFMAEISKVKKNLGMEVA